jgi:hypothetical protein
MKTITVTIGADASTKVETKGFKGTECLKATAALEGALGGATATEHTPEMFQRADEKLRQR